MGIHGLKYFKKVLKLMSCKINVNEFIILIQT